MAIFILHVISAKAARSTIYRKIGHTLQRHHLFAGQGSMKYPAAFPHRFEIFSKNKLIGFPAHPFCTCRTACQ